MYGLKELLTAVGKTKQSCYKEKKEKAEEITATKKTSRYLPFNLLTYLSPIALLLMVGASAALAPADIAHIEQKFCEGFDNSVKIMGRPVSQTFQFNGKCFEGFFIGNCLKDGESDLRLQEYYSIPCTRLKK